MNTEERDVEGKKVETNKKAGACSKHRACNSLFKEHLDDNYPSM